MIADDAIVEGEETFTVTIITNGTYAPGSGSNYLRVNIADSTTEGSESGHIHLISENMAQTSIFLGNDDKYVKVAADDQIYIKVPNVDTSATSQLWTFAGDGSVTFPDATVQTTAWTGTSALVNGTYTVALSITGQLNLPGAANAESNNARIQSTNSVDVLSNLSIWTFGTNGALTLPDGGTLRMSPAPTSSTGTVGDVAGTIAVNSSSIFYCIADYVLDTGTYYVETTNSNDGSVFFIEIAKGSYPQPQIGWGVSINGSSPTIDGVTTDLGTSWRISVDVVTAYSTGTTAILTNPSPSQADIWVKQAWGTTGSW
jgi:hypothetical protein